MHLKRLYVVTRPTCSESVLPDCLLETDLPGLLLWAQGVRMGGQDPASEVVGLFTELHEAEAVARHVIEQNKDMSRALRDVLAQFDLEPGLPAGQE